MQDVTFPLFSLVFFPLLLFCFLLRERGWGNCPWTHSEISLVVLRYLFNCSTQECQNALFLTALLNSADPPNANRSHECMCLCQSQGSRVYVRISGALQMDGRKTPGGRVRAGEAAGPPRSGAGVCVSSCF